MASESDGNTRIFISYSSSDRARVNGLGLLLQALGHEVFLDHRTILPGRAWRAELQTGLEEADALLVFWTRSAARSEWVRKEYEYFHGHHPGRPLVPVLGDEHPLSELLKTRQHSDFATLVNELLELKRTLKKQGMPREKINEAILERLREAGIELDQEQANRLLLLFGYGGVLGAVATAFLLARRWLAAVVEGVAQLTMTQAALVVAALLAGLLTCPLFMDCPGETASTGAGSTSGTVSRPVEQPPSRPEQPVQKPPPSQPESGGGVETASADSLTEACRQSLTDAISSAKREQQALNVVASGRCTVDRPAALSIVALPADEARSRMRALSPQCQQLMVALANEQFQALTPMVPNFRAERQRRRAVYQAAKETGADFVGRDAAAVEAERAALSHRIDHLSLLLTQDSLVGAQPEVLTLLGAACAPDR